MQKTSIMLGSLLLGLLLIGLLFFGCVSPSPQACTQEAKICPDGSAVGRVLPNCDFSPCPGAQVIQQNATGNITVNSTANGNVTASNTTNMTSNANTTGTTLNTSSNATVTNASNVTIANPANASLATNVSADISNQSAGTMRLEEYNGGFFTIKKPAGWKIYQAGSCATFSFIMRDESRPERQIFYYGEVGPVYLAEEQKQVDRGYRDMGGSLPVWYEMPVVNPLTPENFLQGFHLIADTNISKRFMPQAPELGNITIISSVLSQSPLSGETKTMRALFMQDGTLSEGMFYVTVAPLIPLTGYAWGGIGYAFLFIGISADKSEFKGMEKDLTESVGSLTLSQEYVDNCLRQQDKQAQSVLEAAKTLSETSDIMMSAWENRNKADDILSEKRSDAMLSRDRVYDPDTGTVYDVQNGFYDDYNINRDEFDMDNLQRLPDNSWDLWTSATQPAIEIH